MYLYTRPTPPMELKELALLDETSFSESSSNNAELDAKYEEEIDAWQDTISDYNKCKSFVLDW